MSGLLLYVVCVLILDNYNENSSDNNYSSKYLECLEYVEILEPLRFFLAEDIYYSSEKKKNAK